MKKARRKAWLDLDHSVAVESRRKLLRPRAVIERHLRLFARAEILHRLARAWTFLAIERANVK
ncbi:hypothetical protein, partial [Paraburkholderia youngii]|uniref:hypothetical protein n=1 Tax=Paraburkholderia youngii TaxID=2782701 RepID=UPI001C3CB506